MVLQYLHKSVIIFFKVQSEKLKISETKKENHIHYYYTRTILAKKKKILLN